MTSIEWTDQTWNPVTGCDRVSPGCANCYALDLAARLKAMGQARYQRDGDPKTSGPGFGVTLHPDRLEEPLHWRRPRMVFVNSMSDLFHEAIPDEFVAEVFAMMAGAEQHIFQVLTKRPERMRELLSDSGWQDDVRFLAGNRIVEADGPWVGEPYFSDHRLADLLPLRNAWLGVSIENRRFVHRADLLRETPAAVRFVSAEPLLGPLVYDDTYCTNVAQLTPQEGGEPPDYEPCWADGRVVPELDLAGIDWLIVGGESGPKHRSVQDEWVRDLRDAALGEGTAFFFKQWGGSRPKSGGRVLDGRTWDELPSEYRRAAA